DVVIAIIDSGVDMDHPDILRNMWFNKGEKALNGIDDDNNGYIDDLNGWDFLINSSDPHPKFDPGYGFTAINHGTTVAGVAASVTDNDIGLAGVCWNCKIMALRAVGVDGLGTTDIIAKAIDYAIDNRADIINMSFVGDATDEILSNAIRRAHDAGVVLVAAVGNDAHEHMIFGGDLDFNPVYPVCSDGRASQNNVIGVGSVDSDNAKSEFSNYGFQCIDINTPGNGIAGPQVFDPSRGEDFDAKYRTGWRGTSVSAPIVAGVAGLMKSVNPKLTNDQIVSIIRQTGQNIDAQNPLYKGQLGAGLLDAKAAVDLAKQTLGSGTGVRSQPASLREALLAGSAPVSVRRSILISSGKDRKVEALVSDKVGNASAQWLAYPEFFRGGAELVSGDVDGDGELEIISGAGGGGGPQVRIFNQQGQVEAQFFAYDSSFRGGVRVATADFDNDGIDEIVASAGAGLSSEVRIFDKQGNIKWSFNVTADGLSGGITVNAADIDNDGEIEIITGTGGGSLPMVQIFDKLGNREAQWMAYPEFFKGGVNVAVGDIDSDGELEVVTAAGNGGGPQVRVFDAKGNVEGQFFAFEDTFRGGANITVGNIDSDPEVEIITGSGRGRESEVRVFRKFGANFVQESAFSVFESDYEGGVHVGI
ncbi:S8 family serine peptidase, partial [Patescibacteria group bacterium]|nr:S8 family serine peptidase [Patescibacteria group bacterium]